MILTNIFSRHMSTFTNILQGICAYHIKKNGKKKRLPTLSAKSQTETLNTAFFFLKALLEKKKKKKKSAKCYDRSRFSANVKRITFLVKRLQNPRLSHDVSTIFSRRLFAEIAIIMGCVKTSR